jgi:hypothetical protein
MKGDKKTREAYDQHPTEINIDNQRLTPQQITITAQQVLGEPFTKLSSAKPL